MNGQLPVHSHRSYRERVSHGDLTSSPNYNYLPDGDEQCFFDSKPFKAYSLAIEQIVHAAGEPVGTRYIHEKLGAQARREWTLDALEHARSLRKVPGLIDRWERDPAARSRQTPKDQHGKNPSWIFSGQAKDDREKEFARQADAAEKPSPAHRRGRPRKEEIRSGRLFDRKEIRRLVRERERMAAEARA